jgi:AcrR family transcriptional regulator
MGIQERKERERERRRQDIMVAARRVFSTKGYEKATMEDIAREVELSPGTLYLYFKNKDDLYASLNLRVLQFLSVKLDHALSEPALDLDGKLDRLMAAMMAVYEFDPLILNNVFHLQSSETLNNISPELLEEINALSRTALRSVAGMFAAEIEKGTLIDANPTALADLLWGLFSGIALWEETKRMVNPDRYQFEKNIRTGFDLLRRGLQKRPRPVSG